MSTFATAPWLIYALGGGWGHLVRSLALGRLAAADRPVIILSNSPYIDQLLHFEATRQRSATTLLPIIAGCYIQGISANASFQATSTQVRQLIVDEHYECVIIDTFPRGLGGELADILPQLKTTARILVHRDINPDYVQQKNLVAFVAENFDLVMVPGEGSEVPLTDLPAVRYTDPWLIRSANEVPNRAQARSLLGLQAPESQPVVLVCAAGREEELALYGQLTVELARSLNNVIVRCLSAECPPGVPPELWVFHWPAMECWPAANVVVGGGGYNTVYECAAVKVPLVAFAFERKYDRQAVRLFKAKAEALSDAIAIVETLPDAIATVRQFLWRSPLDPDVPQFINGAMSALALIETVICDRNSDMV